MGALSNPALTTNMRVEKARREGGDPDAIANWAAYLMDVRAVAAAMYTPR